MCPAISQCASSNCSDTININMSPCSVINMMKCVWFKIKVVDYSSTQLFYGNKMHMLYKLSLK